MYDEWMKKGYLEKIWNGVRLEEEEREDLEIRRCKKNIFNEREAN